MIRSYSAGSAKSLKTGFSRRRSYLRANEPEPERDPDAAEASWLDAALESDDDSDEEQEEETSESSEAPSGDELTQIAEAGCRWIRDLARRNTVAEPFRRFRLKAYGHKAARVVDTAAFVCRNTDHDLELPIHRPAQVPEPELTIPTPTFEEIANTSASRGFKVLGDYYAQWGQIVLGSVGQLQGLNNAMTSRLHKQLQESREQIDQLVASILEFRVAEVRMADERKSDQRAERARREGAAPGPAEPRAPRRDAAPGRPAGAARPRPHPQPLDLTGVPMPKAQKKTVPAFLSNARAFYAEAFAHRTKVGLADAMTEWSELDDAEQSFTVAHLAYLDLEAQAVTQQLLVQIRDLLDEVAEAFTAAIELSIAEPPVEAEPDPPLDAFPTPEPVAHPDIIDATPTGDAG